MTPFLILLISLIVCRSAAFAGVKLFKSREISVSVSLTLMFFFTGVTHFTTMKFEYLAMIPEGLPRGLWVIYATGFLELAGAAGLLIPRFRGVAALCLAVLLIAMTPANIHAAYNEVPFRGEPPASLWLRLPIQIAFIALLGWVTWAWRARFASNQPSRHND